MTVHKSKEEIYGDFFTTKKSADFWNDLYKNPSDLFTNNKQGSTTFDKLTTPYTLFNDATIADGERVDFVISSASAKIDNIFVRICGYYVD